MGDGSFPATAAELSTASPSSSSTRACFRGLPVPEELQMHNGGQGLPQSLASMKGSGWESGLPLGPFGIGEAPPLRPKSPKGSNADTLLSSPSSARIGGGRASDSLFKSCLAVEFGGAGCSGDSSTSAPPPLTGTSISPRRDAGGGEWPCASNIASSSSLSSKTPGASPVTCAPVYKVPQALSKMGTNDPSYFSYSFHTKEEEEERNFSYPWT